MSDLKIWDGCPEHPEKSGWHWFEDADGLRPLLWRGDDWPDAMGRSEWRDGCAVLSAYDLSHGFYHGPIAMTLCLAIVCRRSLRLPPP